MDLRVFQDDPEALRILDERARLLALHETSADEGLGEEMLSFRLGDGRYSLPARCAREVQPLKAYTPLPATPPFVLGLVNVRGRLLAALDLRPLLDLEPAPVGDDAMLLVISGHGMEVGLLADSVLEVRRGDRNLAPTLSTTVGRGTAWVSGVDRNLQLVLDPELLLADPRLIVNQGSVV